MFFNLGCVSDKKSMMVFLQQKIATIAKSILFLFLFFLGKNNTDGGAYVFVSYNVLGCI